MNLNHRITRLEQTLANTRCTCTNNADLAWPGHNPPQHRADCGGERLIHQLEHHPRAAEPLIRNALPLMAKTYNGTSRPDLSKLTDHELEPVKSLRASARSGKRGGRMVISFGVQVHLNTGTTVIRSVVYRMLGATAA